ncbi:actin cortical patch component, with EF hand and WH2 domain-containing protein [Apostichopus japonicus]|uniref:Actin cortical patch component, with EF hand and WH2 domain-containing protein n=1 Tax=Stichopus japonicus TaxID=307972 RepID=A0A2G8JJZ8_STIJA|nr:actin cortical patch component, with EF hand and WH2 domain-containing protein [Apostichopus japonicus]
MLAVHRRPASCTTGVHRRESRRNARDLAGFNPAVRRRLRQKTAGETPTYRRCTASVPPVNRQRNAGVPPVYSQCSTGRPPKKLQRTAGVPPVDHQRNASVRRINASVPLVSPVFHQKTAEETPVYRGVLPADCRRNASLPPEYRQCSAEFLSERATGYPLANIQCSGDLLAQIWYSASNPLGRDLHMNC